MFHEWRGMPLRFSTIYLIVEQLLAVFNRILEFLEMQIS